MAIQKIIYETSYKGEKIKASGLAFIPTGLKGPAPIICLQRGTTFRKEDAPSVSKFFLGMEFFSYLGYIAFMPDYIGYGESSDIFHPYYDQKSSAATVIDLIKAGKEFLHKKNVLFSDKLFLAGYSEGGYVTLAAQKEIEANSSHNLKLAAVAAGAGGYDLVSMLGNVSHDKSYPYPSYLAFVLKSFNNSYDWNKDFRYFFSEKYAKKMESLMDGSHDGSYINAQLTSNLDELFNPEFYNNLKGPGEIELKKALIHNSVCNWKPVTPLRLYHGTEDEIIPYKNSEFTYNNFKSNGAQNIELIPIPGGTHGTSLEPMLKSCMPWFEKFR